MMGLDFFRRSVELVEKHRKPHQRISYTIQTNGTLIDEEMLAIDVSRAGSADNSVRSERPRLAGYSMDQIERWALIDTLESVGGNKAAAARALGVCEKTIYNKLKRVRLQERHA